MRAVEPSGPACRVWRISTRVTPTLTCGCRPHRASWFRSATPLKAGCALGTNRRAASRRARCWRICVRPLAAPRCCGPTRPRPVHLEKRFLATAGQRQPALGQQSVPLWRSVPFVRPPCGLADAALHPRTVSRGQRQADDRDDLRRLGRPARFCRRLHPRCCATSPGASRLPVTTGISCPPRSTTARVCAKYSGTTGIFSWAI